MIRYLAHHEIDKSKWDACIERSVNASPYASAWYLDIISPRWDALIDGDYAAVMPLTKRKKHGIPYLYQPMLSQQLGVFSTLHKEAFAIDSFLEAIPKAFGLIEIGINTLNYVSEKLPFVQVVQKTNYELPLNAPYEVIRSRYAKSHRKNIRKAAEEVADWSIVASSYSEFYVHKIKSLDDKKANLSQRARQSYFNTLKQLDEKGKLQTFLIYDENEALAGGICHLHFGKKVTKQTFSNDSGRRSGLMYFMMDKFIQENAGKELIIDFMGSSIPGIAHWNKGFGSMESSYEFIRINRLPWPLKWLVR